MENQLASSECTDTQLLICNEQKQIIDINGEEVFTLCDEGVKILQMIKRDFYILYYNLSKAKLPIQFEENVVYEPNLKINMQELMLQFKNNFSELRKIYNRLTLDNDSMFSTPEELLPLDDQNLLHQSKTDYKKMAADVKEKYKLAQDVKILNSYIEIHMKLLRKFIFDINNMLHMAKFECK